MLQHYVGNFSGVSEMKSAARTAQPVETFRPANREALVELENFLRAVDSYPERFASEPSVSFEQHRNSLQLHNLESLPRPDRR